MGCKQSILISEMSMKYHRNQNKEKSTQPLTEKELEQRIVAPSETQILKIGGINIRYAWVSQRGYYPDGYIYFEIIIIF
jgi:hypothetical protein